MTIWKREQNLQVGDLVYHVLYGKDWLAMILSTIPYSGSISTRSEKILVKMIPGTEYEDFFEKRPVVFRQGQRRGWVSEHWLIKINSKNVIEE